MERPAGPFSREMGLRWWRESDEVGGRRWVAQGADTAFSFPSFWVFLKENSPQLILVSVT